jgi:hypothetical protein
MTAFQRAAYNGNLDILFKVWEFTQQKLTYEEINNNVLLATDNVGLTAFHMVASSEHIYITESMVVGSIEYIYGGDK